MLLTLTEINSQMRKPPEYYIAKQYIDDGYDYHKLHAELKGMSGLSAAYFNRIINAFNDILAGRYKN